MNKTSNILLLGALMCGTSATFLPARVMKIKVSIPSQSHSNSIVRLFYNRVLHGTQPGTTRNQRPTGGCINHYGFQPTAGLVDQALLPKNLNLSLLRAFQYRGLEPSILALKKKLSAMN